MDRSSIKQLLIDISRSEVQLGSTETSRGAHLELLIEKTESGNGKKWLGYLEERNLNLPSHAQFSLANGAVIPDFFYESKHLAVFIEVPENRQEIDDILFEAGYSAIFFDAEDSWDALIAQHPSIFSLNT